MAVNPLLTTLFVGIGIRLWLARSTVATWIAEKNEVSTPLTSWKRVTEGLALYKAGVSPYSGDVLHEMPLTMRALSYLDNMWGPSIYIFFVVIDLITALVLERIAKHFGRYMLVKQARSVNSYAPDVEKLVLKRDELLRARLYVLAAFLFNPYSIVTCVSKSTAVFNNLAIALAILFTLKGNRMGACFFIAAAAYMSMYPIMLLVPAAIYLAEHDSASSSRKDGIGVASIIQTVICTGAALTGLLYASFMVEGSWDFLHSTYGFILSVTDLTPNMGVFWYFFTEMFEHFRLFFICVFQINVFIFTVPLTIKLRGHPMLLMYLLVSLMAIFKSYPSYADPALYLALLPLWKHVFPYMRNSFIVGCMLLVCSVLAPILYHLWIYAGSANANFYFAITLVYTTAQVFLVTDLLFAYLRREYDLTHGKKEQMIDGKQAQVLLD